MKLTVDHKRSFEESIREAVQSRDRWHLPARIWFVEGKYFEAHPDTVYPFDPQAKMILELSAQSLQNLAEMMRDTYQWISEINWLLNGAWERLGR